MEKNKDTNLLKGYAPKSMNIFSRLIYTFLRLVHLLAIGSVLPLCIIYAKSSGSGLLNISSWTGWLLAFGAMIWTLMFIGLEQYSYPVQAGGAVMVTGGILTNAWSGYNISGLNIFYGAYQVVMSALFAQFLFITIISIWFVCLKFKKNKEWGEIGLWYLGFLMAASLSLGLLFYGLIEPVLREFSGETNKLMLGVSGIFFLYQSFSDGVVLWKGSVFNKNVMAFPLRNQLHDKWSAFSGITIIFSLLAAIVAGMWDVT